MRGQHYKKAVEIVERVRDESYEQISKKKLAAMKTATCKELAEAFVNVIKSGNLFDAFVNAGFRMTLNAELREELQKRCGAYHQDPENLKLRDALEALEEKVEDDLSYKTAGGDTDILKALDFHNKMHDGFNTFDICRAEIGYAECGIYMPSF